MTILDTLKQKYSQYPMQVFEDGEFFEFTIINSGGRDNITVDNTSGVDETELIFRFSYQHRHFNADIDELIQYIDAFLSDSKAAIGFFQQGKIGRGGSLSFAETDCMSPEALASMFGYLPAWLQGETYRIRSWSGEKDIDAEVTMENGRLVCKRIDSETQ